MLYRYKKAYEKISMGLLSFMPQEKDVKKLLETIQQYESNPDWHLFVWKKGEDVVGIIGIRMENNTAILQHISVNPSHRGEGIAKKMIQSLPAQLQNAQIIPAEQVQAFFDKCKQQTEDNEI